MKKVIFLLLALVVVSVPAHAKSLLDPWGIKTPKVEYGPYVSVMLGGQSIMDTDVKGTDSTVTFDPGYGLSLAVGRHWPSGLRVEVEDTYFISDLGDEKFGGTSQNIDGDIHVETLMGNVLYEFYDKDTKLFSYIGAGAGYAWAKGKLTSGRSTDTRYTGFPVVQPLVGVGYRINKNVSLDFGYRFKFGIQEMDFGGVRGDYRSHRAVGGVRFTF